MGGFRSSRLAARPSPGRRATALLSCLVLLAALVGDGHAADCPHHAPASPDAAAATGHHSAHGATPPVAQHAAAHGAHGGNAATDRAPHDGSHEDDACTCIGACHTGAHVLHSAPVRPVLLAQTADAATAVALYQDALRGRTPYLIPFGTSPPL